MVDQCDQRSAGSDGAGLRQCSESKPVENGRTTGRHCRQYGKRCRALGGIRKRKPVAYVNDIHLPTELPKLPDDASIIPIASRWSIEITRHPERKLRMAGDSFMHSRPP